MYIEFDCKQCGKHVRKRQMKGMTHNFCSRVCKAAWQTTQKPVDKEWLYQKYIVEGMDCTQIAKLVNRNSKRVWEWLRDYGIPTRKRGTTGNGLHAIGKPRKPMTEEQRKKISEHMREVRLQDGIVPYLKNGVHHLKGKRGAETPNWKGGTTPERQEVYGSLEWKAVARQVWARDKSTCQRCGIHRKQAKQNGVGIDIHHIVSFTNRELRCELTNLILLCETCHYWVHSSENKSREYIK